MHGILEKERVLEEADHSAPRKCSALFHVS